MHRQALLMLQSQRWLCNVILWAPFTKKKVLCEPTLAVQCNAVLYHIPSPFYEKERWAWWTHLQRNPALYNTFCRPLKKAWYKQDGCHQLSPWPLLCCILTIKNLVAQLRVPSEQLIVVLPFAGDVGAEQNCSAMVVEPLNPYMYTVMHRINFQAGQGRCWLSFRLTLSQSIKGEEEVGEL